MDRKTPGIGRGETSVLPEAQGVDIGEMKKEVFDLGKDGNKCKCGKKVGPTDRFCQFCGVLLSRDGVILPIRENKPPAGRKQTEAFASKGAVEMRGEEGEARGSRTSVDSSQTYVEPDPAFHDGTLELGEDGKPRIKKPQE